MTFPPIYQYITIVLTLHKRGDDFPTNILVHYNCTYTSYKRDDFPTNIPVHYNCTYTSYKRDDFPTNIPVHYNCTYTSYKRRWLSHQYTSTLQLYLYFI